MVTSRPMKSTLDERYSAAVVEFLDNDRTEALRILGSECGERVNAVMVNLLTLAICEVDSKNDGEFDEVLPAGSSLYQGSSEQSMVETIRGLHAFRIGRPREGENRLRSAISLDDSNPIALFALGRHLLLKRGDTEEASKYIERTVELMPTSANARLARAALYAKKGDLQTARRESTGALRIGRLRLRSLFASGVVTLANSPFRGRLPVLFALPLLFLPYIGPAILVTTIALAAASMLILRRVSPELAAFLPAYVPALMVGFLLRWLIIGTLFP